MFNNISFDKKLSVSIQIKDYIKGLILKGMLQKGEKLPSTREMAELAGIGRNTVLKAYEDLEEDGFIYMIKGSGAYVMDVHVKQKNEWHMDWNNRINDSVHIAEQFDIVKNSIRADREIISFRGISPDRNLFDVEGAKRAFMNIISREGQNILNYGYARGYKPLIEYLFRYMQNKGIDTRGKEILITNGFTEGFDILLSTITIPGDSIICENPTHNTAIKIMKLHGLNIIGVRLEGDGVDISDLKLKLSAAGNIKAGYLVPSYHNPTGIVMHPEKRLNVYEIFKNKNVPIIEDGFNEELRYSGAHISPIAAFAGSGNGVVYIGSFSKILFPGLRVGWVLADKQLVSSMESIKKSRNIHTSFLDQAVLYEYLNEGNFEKFIKKSRKVYGERYTTALKCANEYIPAGKITGDGGMYIFVELHRGLNTKELLEKCHKKGVIFMPGDIFYTDGKGINTMRLGFANVEKPDIEKGFMIIGETIKEMEWKGELYYGK